MNPLSNPSYLLPPLIVLAVSLILIVVVWRGTRRSLTSYIFCGFLISIGLWSLLIYGMRSSPDVHYAVLWDRAVPAAGFTAYLLFYHFTRAYTNTRGQRYILVGGYLLLVLFASISPTDLVIKEMRLEYYGYAPIAGAMLLPFMIISTLFLLGGGAYNFLKHYIASHSHDERNRILYLLIAMLFPVLGAFLDGFSNLPPASVWCNLIFCIICTVSIVKYHLLDIRVVIQKSLVYILVSGVVAIPYVAILILLNQVLKTRIEPWWSHALIILLLAILLRPLYTWVQRLVDRMFYRDRYDYLRALERFSRQAQSITNLKELGLTMVKLVSGALRTSSVCLLLPAESKHGLVAVDSTGLETRPSGVVLRNSSPLVKWLDHYGDILTSQKLEIIPQLQSLSLKERNELERMRAKLYVPIKTREGRLSGILVLGEKLSQQAYSWEDRQLLTAVSNQMAMAIDNARLYEETKESEEKLRLMYDSMTSGIAVLDLNGYILQVNKAMLRMHNYAHKKELIGQHAFELVASEDKTKAAKNLQRTLENRNTANLEFTLLRRDGSKFPAYMSAAVLKDGLGNPMGFVTVAEDITERKQAEEREIKLQQELNLSSRLASIGELAAGVAHEINNPLTGIMGFSERLLRKSTDGESKRDLERIYDEVSRAAKVVENLRTFARRREPKKELVNINDILQKALEMRIYELKTGNIEVVTDLNSGLPQLLADFYQILQVFLNIIINAEQTMCDTNRGGKLVITTKKQEGNIRITFTDNGPGISKENLDKLFDPFFTTRGEKGGTGLGLSICHRIVTEHGGRIYAKSKLEKGTTFFIELPLGN